MVYYLLMFFAYLLMFFAYCMVVYMHRKTLHHDSLYSIIMEYRKYEMYNALQYLWEFSKRPGTNDLLDEVIIKYKFEAKYLEDQIKLLKITDIDQRIKYKEHSIDHYRRQITQYFDYFSLAVCHKIIPKRYILEIWTIEDLEKITRIIISMEWGLDEIIKNSNYKNIDEYIRNSVTSKLKKRMLSKLRFPDNSCCDNLISKLKNKLGGYDD